jgi:hypothetical protein
MPQGRYTDECHREDIQINATGKIGCAAVTIHRMIAGIEQDLCNLTVVSHRKKICLFLPPINTAQIQVSQ